MTMLGNALIATAFGVAVGMAVGWWYIIPAAVLGLIFLGVINKCST